MFSSAPRRITVLQQLENTEFQRAAKDVLLQDRTDGCRRAPMQGSKGGSMSTTTITCKSAEVRSLLVRVPETDVGARKPRPGRLTEAAPSRALRGSLHFNGLVLRTLA